MRRSLTLVSVGDWPHYVELDPLDGSYERHAWPDNEPPPREGSEGYPTSDNARNDGWCQILDGHFVAIYRYEGQIHLRIDDETWALDDSMDVAWHMGEAQYDLVVSAGDVELVNFRYSPAWWNLEDTWSSDEDGNVAILLSNVWNSAFRRNTFLRGLPGGGISHRLYFPSEENAMGAAAEINRHRCAEVGRVLCSEEPGFVGEYLVSVLEIPLPPPARTTPPTRDVIRFLSDLAREHGGYYRDASG